VQGVGGFTEGRVRHAERVVHHPRRGFPGIPGAGLVAQVLGLLQEGELVGHCPESGRRLAGRSHSGAEAGDDPRGADLSVRVGCTEEDLVAQVGYQLAEFGYLPGDGDAVGRAMRVCGDRQLAALGIEG
jgi:hypothetical protein